MRCMETVFSWLGTALGALFVVAVLVAWWEHLARNAGPSLRPEPAAPRAASVDVHIDKLAETAPGDATERRTTLDGAMGRAAQAGADAARAAWIETSPMVLRADPRTAVKSEPTPSDH